jgi:hypothetical protein
VRMFCGAISRQLHILLHKIVSMRWMHKYDLARVFILQPFCAILVNIPAGMFRNEEELYSLSGKKMVRSNVLN